MWNVFLAAVLTAGLMLAPVADGADVNQVKAVIEAKRAVQEHPESVEAHREYQNVMIEEGWKAQILEEYTERLKKARTPENLYLWARLQDGEEEAQAFETLVKEFPEFCWGYHGLASVRDDQGALDEAIRLSEQALACDPLNASAYQHLAYYHQRKEDLTQALQVVERGLARLPSHVELLVSRATLRRMLEAYEPARADLTKVLEEEPDHREALRQLFYLYMNTKAFEEAVTVGERYLSLTPTDRQAWVLLAQGHLALYDRQLYEGQKNPKHLLAAELACESAVEADPADAVAVYATLYNYFSDRNWWVHALYYNNRALKLTEQDSPDYEAFEHNRSWIPANRIAGKSWDIEVIAPSSAAPGPASAGGEDLLQATAAMKEKNYRQARRSLQQAAQRAPDDPLVRYHQTLMRMFDEAVVQGTITQLQELRDAVKAGAGINLDTFEVFMEPFEGYLKRDPTSPEIQEAFGDIFAADPGGLYRKSALPYYEKAIELGGDRARLSEKIQTIRSANH